MDIEVDSIGDLLGRRKTLVYYAAVGDIAGINDSVGHLTKSCSATDGTVSNGNAPTELSSLDFVKDDIAEVDL